MPRPHGLDELLDVVLLLVLYHVPPRPHEAKLAVLERPGGEVGDGLPGGGLLRPHEGDRHISEAPRLIKLKGVGEVGIGGPHKEGRVLLGEASHIQRLEVGGRHRGVDRLERGEARAPVPGLKGFLAAELPRRVGVDDPVFLRRRVYVDPHEARLPPLCPALDLLEPGEVELVAEDVALLPGRPDRRDGVLAVLLEGVLADLLLDDDAVGHLPGLEAADDLLELFLRPGEGDRGREAEAHLSEGEGLRLRLPHVGAVLRDKVLELPFQLRDPVLEGLALLLGCFLRPEDLLVHLALNVGEGDRRLGDLPEGFVCVLPRLDAGGLNNALSCHAVDSFLCSCS